MSAPAPHPPGQAGMHRRFALGAGWQMVATAILFAEQFLLVPVFLLFWEVDRYADWLVLLSAAGFVGLVGLGLQTYFSNELQMTWARGRRDTALRLLHRALFIYAVLVSAAAVVVAILGFAAPWPDWLNLGEAAETHVPSAITLLGLYILAGLPFGLLCSLYRMRGEFSVGVAASTLSRAAHICVIVLFLWAGAGLVALAAATLAVTLSASLAVLAHQNRRYPDLRLGFERPDGATLRSMIGLAPYYAIVPLATLLTVQGPVLLISTLGGAGAAVVTFTVIRTLCGSARMITGQISHVAGVEIARQYAQRDAAALERMYRFTGRLCGGLTGGLAGMIAVIGPPFLDIWTLGRVAFEPAVFWLLLAAAAGGGAALAGNTVLHFINAPRMLAAGHIAAGLVTVALCGALIPWIGVPGAAIAVLVSEILVLGTLVPWRAARIVGLNPAGRIAATHGAAAIAFAISFVAARGALFVTGGETLFVLAAAGALWAVAAGLVTPWIILNAGQRRGLLDGLRRRLRRAERGPAR